MKKKFVLLLMLVFVFAIAAMGRSPSISTNLNKEAGVSEINQSVTVAYMQNTLPVSLTALNVIAVEVNMTCPIFFVEMELQKCQNPATITEGLAVKKCNASSFVIFTRLQTTTFQAEQVVGNEIMPQTIVAATLLRDGQGCHILKEVITSACFVAFTGWM